MISISYFRALPEIPVLAVEKGIKLEFLNLLDRVRYSNDFLRRCNVSPWYPLINSAHAPFFDLIPGTADAELKALVKDKFKRALEACGELGIKNIVFHSGWFPKTYPEGEWVDNSLSFWTEILRFADADTGIFIENVYEDTPTALRKLIQGMGRDRFKVCLDIGHVNANSSRGLEEWITELGAAIGHIHIHNNYGVQDDHNGLGAGTIHIDTVLNLFKAQCPNATWNLEVRTEIEESIDRLIAEEGSR